VSLNWRKLNKDLALMSEEQVLALLNAERSGLRRISILERLHQRYTMLRSERERREILREARTL
jgi:hypothetical protein